MNKQAIGWEKIFAKYTYLTKNLHISDKDFLKNKKKQQQHHNFKKKAKY